MIENTNVYSLRMVKEREVNYELPKEPFNSPESLVGALDEIFELASRPEEIFVMLSLDTKLKITGAFKVSQGSINASIVHPREVFKRALLDNACCIVLAHNHPSGDPKPSTEDKNITERLVQAGNLLGIKVIDHIIVGRDDFFSFNRERMI